MACWRRFSLKRTPCLRDFKEGSPYPTPARPQAAKPAHPSPVNGRRNEAPQKPLSYTRLICFILPDDAPPARNAHTAPRRRIPLDPVQGARLHRGAGAARQSRRCGAQRGDDAAVGLSAPGPGAAGGRNLAARAGRRAGAAMRQGGAFCRARRHFGSRKVTVCGAKATHPGRKPTLWGNLPPNTVNRVNFALAGRLRGWQTGAGIARERCPQPPPCAATGAAR